MKTFTDNAGRPWQIAVNVESIKRVRALTADDPGGAVDLCAAAEGELIGRLQNDPITLAATLYALCKPAADLQRVTPEQFGEALAGDAIELATVAFMQELADFFPKGRRAVIHQALAKYTEVEAEALRVAGEKIAAMSARDLIARAFGSSSGGTPASSASTPTP